MIGAIYTKELRARAMALLGLPLLGVAMAFSLWLLKNSHMSGYENPSLTLHPAFQVGTFVACTAAGLLLGILQMITEIGQTPWAFLRHRPASARTLFLGKLAAALTLYTAITLPPLVLGIWWAATHLPGPWLWSMAIPPLMDYLSGTLFIPAGMLIAAREARWFGSRVLPVGLAIVCTIVTWAPWLWLAMAGLALGWVILLPAAMGAFTTRAVESTQRWPLRFLTSLSLLPAMITIPAATGGFLSELLRNPNRSISYTTYQLIDGCVYRIAYRSPEAGAAIIVDADGRRNDAAPEQPFGPAQQKSQYGGTGTLTLNWANSGYGSEDRSLRMEMTYFVPIRLGIGEWWYYVHDWGCYVGYMQRPDESPARIGYLGANGLVHYRSQVQRFYPIGPKSSVINTITEAHRINSVNLHNRMTSVAFAAPPGERAQAAGYLSRRQPNDTFTPIANIATTDQAIHIYGSPEHPALRIPNPEGYALADVSAGQGFYTILYQRSVKWEEMQTPRLLVRVDQAGKELTRMELPAPPQANYDPGPLTRALQGIGMPQAVGIVGIYHSIRVQSLDLTALVSLGVAILCTIIAHRTLRPYPLSSGLRTFWLIVVFALGIAGMLLLLAIRHWPALLPCTSCGRKRLVTQEHCHHCAAPFMAPDPGAVGIFDRSDSPVHA